jgi:hypothetical protein
LDSRREGEEKEEEERESHLPHIHNVIHMITQRHKQIKEKLPPTLHLQLHGSAPLKRLATPDDQRQVMSAQPRIRVRRVVIRIPRAPQDRRDLDAALQALLAQGQPLELLEAVLLRGAVDDGVFEQVLADGRDVGCGFGVPAATGCVGVGGGVQGRVFEFPGVVPLVVQQAGIVVTLLQRQDC